MPQDEQYFFYTRTMPDGHWSPQVAAFHPDSMLSTRNRRGHPPQHTAPIGQSRLEPLAGVDLHLSLRQLVAKYPSPAPAEPATMPDMRRARPGEVIGGGFAVFRAGRRSGRIRPAEFPFEYATCAAAEAAAQKLSLQNPGQRFEVWGVIIRLRCEVRTEPLQPAAGAEAHPALANAGTTAT